jgi:hypothetical protein
MADSYTQDEVSGVALDHFRARHPDPAASGTLSAGPAVRVQRLDSPEGYVLVPIYDVTGFRGIVQLDPRSLSVQSSAVIRNPATQFLASEKEAASAARVALPHRSGWGAPFLGWRPCRESYDSMRPLWVVPHSAGRAYVSQSREVFENLTLGQGG